MISKVCFAASAGGHLEEISRLIPIRDAYDNILMTEKKEFDVEGFSNKVYYFQQIKRNDFFVIFKLSCVFFKSLRILKREKVDCVISTGALVTYPICMAAKVLRKKIIYIETFARINDLSLTGKFMKPLADLYIVQWEELQKIVDNSVFGGSIFSIGEELQ